MIKVTSPERGNDVHGSGHYGASRGHRKHNGVDYSAVIGSVVHSLCDGKVTKLGFPYNDDYSYRYVEVTDKNGFAVRYFYVCPSVNLGDMVKKDDSLGSVQNLGKRYKNITNHIHFEIEVNGENIDPRPWLDALGDRA